MISFKNNYGGADAKFQFRPLLCALWHGKWALFAPIIILGGIYAGIFTPSEAAAVAVAYGLFVGLFIYKGLNLKKIIESFKFTAVVIGTVMFILGSTKAFGQLVTIYDIPESILNLFQVLVNHPEIVMLLIGIFYIFIGMWLESVAQIVIFTAVFLPLAVKLGIDPVVFGIFNSNKPLLTDMIFLSISIFPICRSSSIRSIRWFSKSSCTSQICSPI